jgi:hypothetical protein
MATERGECQYRRRLRGSCAVVAACLIVVATVPLPAGLDVLGSGPAVAADVSGPPTASSPSKFRFGLAFLGRVPDDGHARRFDIGGAEELRRLIDPEQPWYPLVVERIGGPFTLGRDGVRGFDSRTSAEFGLLAALAYRPNSAWELRGVAGLVDGEAEARFPLVGEDDRVLGHGTLTTPWTGVHLGLEGRYAVGPGGGATRRVVPVLGAGLRWRYLAPGEATGAIAGVEFAAGNPGGVAQLQPALGAGVRFAASPSIDFEVEAWALGARVPRGGDIGGEDEFRVEPEIRIGLSAVLGSPCPCPEADERTTSSTPGGRPRDDTPPMASDPSRPAETPPGISVPPPEAPPVPPAPPPRVPPGEPPPVPPAESCDCCCHLVPEWSKATPIKVTIRTPAAIESLSIGGVLPLALDASDLDRLTLNCVKEECGAEPCPTCASRKEIDLPGTLRVRWELLSGPGALVSTPPYAHAHSAVAEGSAALYLAPDTLTVERAARLRVTVDDGPEYLADIDDAPFVRDFEVRLVAPRFEPRRAGGAAGAPGSPTTPSPAGDCSCRPVDDWKAASPPVGHPAAPETLTVCAGGYTVLRSGSHDVDALSARCVDRDCPSPAQSWTLNDAPRFDWQTRSIEARIIGSGESVLLAAPYDAGRITVERGHDDSGVHPGPADEPGARLPPVVVEVFQAELTLAQPTRTPYGPGFDFRYILEPGPADTVWIEIFDADGRRLHVIGGLPTAEARGREAHPVTWNGLDRWGRPIVEEGRAHHAVLVARRKGVECRKMRELGPWRREPLASEHCGTVAGRVLLPGADEGGRGIQALVVYAEPDCEPCGPADRRAPITIAFEAIGDEFGIHPSRHIVSAGTPARLVSRETVDRGIVHLPFFGKDVVGNWDGDRGDSGASFGLLELGDERVVGFVEPGFYGVGCLFHEREDSWVYVVPTDCYAAVETVEHGAREVAYELRDLPEGSYRLTAYTHQIVGRPEVVTVTVNAGQVTRKDIRVTR